MEAAGPAIGLQVGVGFYRRTGVPDFVYLTVGADFTNPHRLGYVLIVAVKRYHAAWRVKLDAACCGLYSSNFRAASLFNGCSPKIYPKITSFNGVIRYTVVSKLGLVCRHELGVRRSIGGLEVVPGYQVT